MTKLMLDDWTDELPEIYILGIHSHLEDFRLAYELNRHQNTFFAVSQHALTLYDEAAKYEFNYFKNVGKLNTPTCYLIKNQSVYQYSVPDESQHATPLANKQKILIKTKQKWPFMLISHDLDWLVFLNKQRHPKVFLASQLIEFESLSKSEKETLITLYYEN